MPASFECCVYSGRFLGRADHSSRGVLLCVMCLNEISKPQLSGGIGPLGLSCRRRIINCTELRSANLYWCFMWNYCVRKNIAPLYYEYYCTLCSHFIGKLRIIPLSLDGLDNRGVGVGFPAKAGVFFFVQSVWTCSEAPPSSYTMVNSVSFFGVKGP